MVHPETMPHRPAGSPPIIPGGRPPPVRDSLARLGRRLRALVQAAALAETDRWLLWLPVLFATGAAVYLGWPGEPAPAAVAAVAAAPVVVIAISVRRHWPGEVTVLAVALLVTATGAVCAQWRAVLVSAPMLDRAMAPTGVAGRVTAIDHGDGRGRLRLSPVRVAGLADQDTPRAVRLSVRRPAWLATLSVGDWVTMRAGLLPPPEPVMPGGFDFRRRAFFDGLGALGYVTSAPAVMRAFRPDGPLDTARLAIERLRDRITARLRMALPGQAGMLAAALMTGDRAGLSDAVQQAMRESGLAHLLAISGLHVGMVAGILFFSVRLGLALMPSVALRVPIKKLAAVIALAGAFFYLLLAGATVPTQRAFLMTGIALLAILCDRSPLSIRLVAVSAAVVLVRHPEAVADVSFQMSFAAVIGLIATFEALRAGWHRARSGAGPIRRIGLYVAGLTITSLVAGTATAPFALFHFGQVATYGVIGNLMAIPLMAFWIMPLGMIGLALMPVGLEVPALTAMGWGLDLLTAEAGRLADLPGAVLRSGQFPVSALALIAVGGLWVALWRRCWRWAGLVPVALGVAGAWAAPVPDIVVAGDGAPVALRLADGRVIATGPDRQSYERRAWARRLRASRIHPWSRDADGQARCDRNGCMAVRKGYRVAVPTDPAGAAEDCRRAAVIVAGFALHTPCPGPIVVIADRQLRRGGAHAVYLSAAGVRVDTTRPSGQCRPWTRFRERVCAPEH